MKRIKLGLYQLEEEDPEIKVLKEDLAVATAFRKRFVDLEEA